MAALHDEIDVAQHFQADSIAELDACAHSTIGSSPASIARTGIGTATGITSDGRSDACGFQQATEAALHQADHAFRKTVMAKIERAP